jgi:hypothetical protein
MIGPFETAVEVTLITSTPTDIMTAPLYGYDGSYLVADTLNPGDGFWVLVDYAGTLNLGDVTAASLSLKSFSKLAKTIPFIQPISPQATSSTRYEIWDLGCDLLAPPPAPSGSFDARITNLIDYVIDYP